MIQLGLHGLAGAAGAVVYIAVAPASGQGVASGAISPFVRTLAGGVTKGGGGWPAEGGASLPRLLSIWFRRLFYGYGGGGGRVPCSLTAQQFGPEMGSCPRTLSQACLFVLAAPEPEEETIYSKFHETYGTDIKTGDWICPMCGVLNFQRRKTCFGCGSGAFLLRYKGEGRLRRAHGTQCDTRTSLPGCSNTCMHACRPPVTCDPWARPGCLW